MLLVQTICMPLIIFWLNKFEVQIKSCVLEIYGQERLLGQNFCWFTKYVGRINFRGQKTILVLANFGLKYIFGSQDDCSPTILG